MARHIKQGNGWRLGWDPDAPIYKALVAGESWSLELTEPEFQDFCRLTNQLDDTMTSMAAELMDAERITCEAESEWLWLEVEGVPHAYSLHMILLQGRRGEGEWSVTAVSELLQALPKLVV